MSERNGLQDNQPLAADCGADSREQSERYVEATRPPKTARAAIYSEVPKPFRTRLFGLFLLVLALGLGAAFAMLAYDFGKKRMVAKSNKEREQTALLRQEVERLNGVLAAADSMRNIERATQKQLAEQVKALESENARLKEDLSFYERLLPAKPKDDGIAIRRFAAEAVPPNQLRYRLLILARDGAGKQSFAGKAQIIVTAVQQDRRLTIVFPQPGSPEEQHFNLRFKHYQRLEGILSLPEGALPKSVQARILENGQIKVQQTVKP